MLNANIIMELSQSKVKLNDIEMQRIYDFIQLVPKYDLPELCEELYDMIIENANKVLKNHNLGRTIFHLYEIERLNTYIGLEKLVYGGIVVDSEKMIDIFGKHDIETKKVGAELKHILEN